MSLKTTEPRYVITCFEPKPQLLLSGKKSRYCFVTPLSMSIFIRKRVLRLSCPYCSNSLAYIRKIRDTTKLWRLLLCDHKTN